MADIDFHRAVVKANDMLVKAGISRYPFDPRKVVKLIPNCACRKFSTARKWGIDIKSFGSESAFVVELDGRFIIFYDETKPKCHITFSILHEIGHLVLKHPLHCKNISAESYHKYEVEANFFAAQMLMPTPILNALRHRELMISQSFLIQHFGVSPDAASKRLTTMRNASNITLAHSERELDDIIVMQADAFIESIKPSCSFFDLLHEEEMQRQRECWT